MAPTIAWAAMKSGCDFFAGYPITPASSILHYMNELVPEAGGTHWCVQQRIRLLNCNKEFCDKEQSTENDTARRRACSYAATPRDRESRSLMRMIFVR